MNQVCLIVQGLLSMDMDLAFKDLHGQEEYYLIILPLVNVVEVFAPSCILNFIVVEIFPFPL